jgi:hypothetical protein
VRRAALVLTALTSAVVLASCSVDPVVLATIPVGEDAGDGAGPMVTCATSDDCYLGTYCEKSSCGAATGLCQPAEFPTSDEQPVCGCDGITYFNDSLRQEHGISGMKSRRCDPYLPTTQTCRGRGECSPTPDGTPTYCGRLGGCGMKPPAPPGPLGICWVLPPSCPAPVPMGPARWSECGGGPQGPCVDTCAAVQSEEPYSLGFMCGP